jgi:hypothetical protein
MTMQTVTCRVCGCTANDPAHTIVAVLVDDDLDAAIELGLADVAPCNACAPDCRAALIDTRDNRLRALSARERFRARNARLQRRAEARAAGRVPAPTLLPDAVKSTLPPAAAAALARAKAKATAREPR